MYDIVCYSNELCDNINSFVSKFNHNVMQGKTIPPLQVPLHLGSFVYPQSCQTVETLIRYPQNLKVECELQKNKAGVLVLTLKTEQWIPQTQIKQEEKELVRIGNTMPIPENRKIIEIFTLNPLSLSIERNTVKFYNLSIEVGKMKGAIPKIIMKQLRRVEENAYPDLEKIASEPFRQRESTVPSGTEWSSLQSIKEHLAKGNKN